MNKYESYRGYLFHYINQSFINKGLILPAKTAWYIKNIENPVSFLSLFVNTKVHIDDQYDL